MTDNDTPSTTRRAMMKGVGGFAALSMSNTTIGEAAEIMQSEGPPTDSHTLDTYRAVVDAIVPRTPELGDELGEEHVPGGLAVELEEFIIYDFNHFHEIRLETLETGVPSGSSAGSETLRDSLSLESFTGGTAVDETGLTEEERMPLSVFETTIDTTGSGSDLDALLDLADVDTVEGVDTDALAERVDFGALDRLEIDIADTPIEPGDSGLADVELTVEAGNEVVHQVSQNYRYAELFPVVFDVVAAELLLRGRNEDPPAPNEQFPAGGTFIHLSREDRLRALWDIVDGGVLDRLDELFSPMLPAVGILKYVVMAVNGLHGFGYYTEWSAYGDTKTNLPQKRELQQPPDEGQSRTQTDYPGPVDGYAANWFHAVDGGFRDPPAQSLNYDRKDTDLTGDDVLSEDELAGSSGTDDGATDGVTGETL
jgi:hypothetical protein